MQVLGEALPEPLEVLVGLVVDPRVPDIRLPSELVRRRESPFLLEQCVDVPRLLYHARHLRGAVCRPPFKTAFRAPPGTSLGTMIVNPNRSVHSRPLMARVIQLSPRAERGVKVLANRGLVMGCTASIPVLVRRHLDSSLLPAPMLRQAGRFAPFGMTRGRGLYSPSVEN